MSDSATDQVDLDAEVAEPEGAVEPQLDPEVAARRAAALAHVRKFGDPSLRTRVSTTPSATKSGGWASS
jgi:hypothetical protein